MADAVFADNNISPLIGAKAYQQTFITDDATCSTGAGGVQTVILGSFGTGKSTMLAEMAMLSRYMIKGSKDSYIHHIIHKGNLSKYITAPTTVIWRARDLDLWPVMIPANWEQRDTYITPKKMRVFVHKLDYEDVTFFAYDKDHKPIPIPNMPEIKTYSDADDLTTKLLEGGINVIVEPQKYRLSPRLCSALQQARAEYVGESDAQKEDDKKDDEEDQPKRRRGRPQKVTDYSQHAVKPAVFWFDMTNAVMQLWGNKPILFIWDEGDDFLSSASADVHWWLITIHTELQRDFRKANISTVISSHGWNLLADSVYKRATHKILLPGLKAGRNTMIKYTSTINRLPKGWMIVELSNREFGVARFWRIPDAIQCKIDGLKGNYHSLKEEQKFQIRKAYSERWRGTDIIDLSKLPSSIESITVPELIQI